MADVWDDSVAPGGFVCGTCRVPTESEPCAEHGAPENAEVEQWVREAVIALRAATTINERMLRTGRVEGLNLGNHDRLIRQAENLHIRPGATS